MRQTNVAFAFRVCFFKVLSKSYIARFRCSFRKLHSATQRVKSIVTLFAICTSFVTAASFIILSHFTHYTPLLPVALGSVTLHSFQSLKIMPAANNFARLLVALGCGAVTVFVGKTKTPPAPCVYNIGRTRALVGTPVLPPKAPLAGRLAKAAQVSAIHSVSLHSLQPLLHPHSRGRYNPDPQKNFVNCIMEIEKFGQNRTLIILHEEHDDLNKQFQKLSTSIIEKHGIAKALKSNRESSAEELAFDIAFFCFTKSIRLNESIEAVIKICNYEDAYALLRGAYELYVYMAFIRADNNRISDSIFKIGLEEGMYKHPVTKKGKPDKSRIIDTTDNNVYAYGSGIFEKIQKTPFTTDIPIHNIIYKFLSDHCHVHIITSGNYRDDKTLRYKIKGGNHDQLPYLLFLKNFIYTNLLYEISFYIKPSKADYNRVIKKVHRNKRFLLAFLHYAKFSSEEGALLNPIFLERINAIELP